MAVTIAIDPGHGGTDPGAVYEDRKEKDDALRLSLAVGKYLSDAGYNVVYTRDNDIYETPFKKATDAGDAGAEYFISIHRNSSLNPGEYDGFESLVFDESGVKNDMAKNINANMEKLGFKNLGISKRPNLVVLKRTKMPAILLEVGFINNEKDNALFDGKFDAIAKGIADGIIDTINGTVKTDDNRPLYRVQVGAYKNKANAERLLNSLLVDGIMSYIIYDDGYYKVQVGAFEYLNNAVEMERRLRNLRYSTFITT